MLQPQFADRRGIENSGSDLSAAKKILHPIAKRPPQPGRQRNRKPCFWPADEMPRHIFVQHTSQKPLALPAAHTEIAGKRPGKFDDAMIEQRRADLKGNSHGCTIDFLEDVVRQVSRHVPELHTFKQATALAGPTHVQWFLVSSSGQHSGIMTLTDEMEISRLSVERHDLGQLAEFVARLGHAHRSRQKTAHSIDRAARY